MDRIKQNKRIILIVGAVTGFFFVLLTFVISILILSTKNLTTQQDSQTVNTTSQVTSLKNNRQNDLLIYGTWTKDSSIIKTINLTTKEETTLATLPLNIKRVNVLDSKRIIYINQTDDRDFGKEISSYSITSKTTNTVANADEGFGIDKYFLSPNKRYLTTFEIALKPNSSVMLGATTRIYSIDLLVPGVKNLILEEVSSENNPIHYPIAITNSGEIYFDKYIPNSGANWARGMSVSNFDGTQKQELSQVQDSTYATQPILSPKGDKLIFSGYDGKYGPGTNIVDGLRQAILTPNTVEILDVKTKIRQKLPNLPNSDTYNFAFWDIQSGNPIIGIISKKERIGTYEYDLTSNTYKKLRFMNDPTIPSVVLATFSDGQVIKGQYSTSTSIGNLGEYYARLFSNFYLVDQNDQKEESISSANNLKQFITIIPSFYLTKSNVLGAETKDTLQLETFLPFIKVNLKPIRLKQQSTPIVTTTPSQPKPTPEEEPPPKKCDITKSGQCRHDALKNLPPGTDVNSKEYLDYVAECNANSSVTIDITCADTPLYLYGNYGQKINVKIGRTVFNSIPEYINGFDVSLLNDGKMEINGKIYNSIYYDFELQSPFIPPNYGIIVSKEKIEEAIYYYAKNLGLNQKETLDLIKVTKNKIDSPFVFVSFFNQQESEQILPIDFNPKPNAYLNVVFYFRKLYQNPNYTPILPTFPKTFTRDNNFTAVEISEIVD